ncbi:MAG: hypothetical protein KDE27_20055 [Planctomycetes bacterium]|nr:hypothetical protein [Planctomycetota bacterium]
MTKTRSTLSRRLALASPLTLGLVAAPIAAQTAANRFVPEDAQIVLRIAAPAKWNAQFGNTKIAGVITGQTFGPMLEQMQHGFTGAMTGEMDVEKELAESLWNDYQGDITVAIHFDLEDLGAAIEEERTPTMSVVIAMSPDGKFDLAEFARQIGDSFENQSGADIAEISAGDYTLRCEVSDEFGGSKPIMIDDCLVTVLSTNLEESAARMLASDGRRESVGAGKPLYVHVEAGAAVQSLLDVVAQKMDDNLNAPPLDVVQLLTDFGLTSLRDFELSLEADGAQVVLDAELGLNQRNSGIFGALAVDKKSLDTLRYVPASADAFSVQLFDIGALYDTIAKMTGSMSDILPMSWEDIENGFADAAKVRLREDLIANIGKEMLSLTDWKAHNEAAADADPGDFSAMFAGQAFAISLTNGKAFGDALETAMRSRGMHAARKSEEYQGVTLYRLRLAGAFEIEYAVTADLLLLALSSDEASRAQLRSILDARANPSAGLPKAVADAESHVPGGWNGVGVTPMGTVLSTVGDLLNEAPPGEVPMEVEQALGAISMLGKEMKRAGVDDAVQFIYSSPRGIRSIMRL